MCVEDKSSREIGDGFVPKCRKWLSHVDWADVIVFDYTGYGKIATELRDAGKLVIGGTEYSDLLELDRNFGQNELRKHKVKILNYKEFSHTDDAIAYVEKHPKQYVIKPCGEMQDYKQLLYVGQEDDGGDIIRMLRAYQKSWGKDLGVFQLQRKVTGVEVAVSAFFNGKEFIKPYNITFEHKNSFHVSWAFLQAKWAPACSGPTKVLFSMLHSGSWNIGWLRTILWAISISITL